MEGFGIDPSDGLDWAEEADGAAGDAGGEELGELDPGSDEDWADVGGDADARSWAPPAPRRARVGGDEASGAWLDGKRLDRRRRSRNEDSEYDYDVNTAVRGLAEFVSANIRYEMARSDVTQKDVADVIGKSRAAVSLRMHDRVPWTLWEVGMVAELLGMQPSELLSTRVRRW